ncbi:hypothetical protein ACF1D2_27425 [Streptomyces bacillaris]|uniref:hypothetical protein n=1 Tax=Streptomyces bacillaris TaxID=68179 RepID=UPI0036762732
MATGLDGRGGRGGRGSKGGTGGEGGTATARTPGPYGQKPGGQDGVGQNASLVMLLALGLLLGACVLNPATAPCQLRGTADDPLVTPDIDDCRPQCPNLARTDRDIAYNERQVAELEETHSNSLAPPIRHARERHELARLQAILDAHRKGRKPTL